MFSMIHCSRAKRGFAALVVICLFSLAAPIATAAEDPSGSAKATREVSAPANASETPNSEVSTEPKTLGISYAAYEGAITLPAEPPLETASRPRSVARLLESVDAATSEAFPMPPQSQSHPGVISTAPMTAGEKFEAWFQSRFLRPGAYANAVFSGLFVELQDDDDFKEDTVSNYFADSMTRAARSFAFGTTAAFFEKAVLASLFRQDPRYHRSDKKGVGAKIGYAVTRVFITQGDRCACHQFNISYLLGGAGASVVANAWERSERTGPVHTVKRWGTHIALTALFNVVREFVGGQ